MDQTVLARFQKTPAAKLARIASPRSVQIVGAYQGETHPVWIAKTSADPLLREKLRTEYRALNGMRSQAEELGVPRLLDWQDEGQICTLIRTGMPGEADSLALAVTSPGAVWEKHYRRPLDWLWRFQAQVQPQDNLTWSGVAETSRTWLRQTGNPRMARLASTIERYQSGAAESRKAVALHGDFFPRNILLHGQEPLRVVDWDHFGVGSPLHDVFCLFVGSDLHVHGRMHPMDEIMTAMVFSKLPLSGYVLGEIRQRGFSAGDLAFLFYCYVAHLLETSRGGREEVTWDRMLLRLDEAGFPTPGTPLK